MSKGKQLYVSINGEEILEDDAKISVFDHGLLYGDGVFEDIRAYDGVVFQLDDHLKRLYNSAKTIALKIPIESDKLKQNILLLLRKNELRNANVRVIITRGKGDLSLDPETCKKPTIIIITKEVHNQNSNGIKKGIKTIISHTRRVPFECISSNLKSLNYMNRIIARLEANNAQVPEAIMLDLKGYIAEGSNHNLFYVKNGELYTTKTKNTASGITRNVIISIANDEGFPVHEDDITLYEIFTADEVFLTSTHDEVLPVIIVDGRSINDGKSGPVTLKLFEEFNKIKSKWGTPI